MTEEEAREKLSSARYRELPGQCHWWRLPSPDHEITESEMAAIRYLVIHCDHCGMETWAMREGARAFLSGLTKDANPHTFTADGGRPRLEWRWGWEIQQQIAWGKTA